MENNIKVNFKINEVRVSIFKYKTEGRHIVKWVACHFVQDWGRNTGKFHTRGGKANYL